MKKIISIAILCIFLISGCGNKAPVAEKSSHYSVEDCYSVCDQTNTMADTIKICQNVCNAYEGPGESLDAYVNGLKETYTKYNRSFE